MDEMVRHILSVPRRFPSPFQVATVGYLPQKREWVEHRFGSCNFSFILKGGGEYNRGGRKWEVSAPCVITQWPGELVNYGYAKPWEWWEELYVIYPAETRRRFERCGFIRQERPVWKIHDIQTVGRVIDDLMVLLGGKILEAEEADRMDRVCERLVFESFLGERVSDGASGSDALEAIREQVRKHYAKRLDFDELARGQGMSPATFRRAWRGRFKMGPGRYLIQTRMQAACRLLAETEVRVSEVASTVGYEDPLYFSRHFRSWMKIPPREYRLRHQVKMEGGAGKTG